MSAHRTTVYGHSTLVGEAVTTGWWGWRCCVCLDGRDGYPEKRYAEDRAQAHVDDPAVQS